MIENLATKSASRWSQRLFFQSAILTFHAESFCVGPRACEPHIFNVCENKMHHAVFANIENVRLASPETPTERLGVKS